MARKPLRHEAAAANRVDRAVRGQVASAMDASRARGNPGLAIYGRGGPKGGPELSPTQRPPERTSISPTDVQKIEHALGSAKAHAVVAALRQAGLVAGGAKSAPAPQDRGSLSPLGGRAV